MKKILVTTDFSASSRAGLRFAIQLATQMEAKLVFFHCFQALIPTTVHRVSIEKDLGEQGDQNMQTLKKFVASIHKAMRVQAGTHRYVVVENLNPERAIIEYAETHNFDYICMSTRGAGTLRKIVGTQTGSVLRKSSVPVLVVPHTYRVKTIKKILYSSDLENFEKEMAIVSDLAESIQVQTDLAHFYYPGEITLDAETLTQMWRLKHPKLDQVVLKPFNLDYEYAVQLGSLSKKLRPSLVVYFTHTNKTWFDKLFSVSISENVSFITNIPMLVYRKSSK